MMTKLPDRFRWNKRTKSYMAYPGIPPVMITVGNDYEIVYVEVVGDDTKPFRRWFTAERESHFKSGRRWTMSAAAPEGFIGPCMFLPERDILEQNGYQLFVGYPWNYARFNPNHSDHFESKIRLNA